MTWFVVVGGRLSGIVFVKFPVVYGYVSAIVLCPVLLSEHNN